MRLSKKRSQACSTSWWKKEGESSQIFGGILTLFFLFFLHNNSVNSAGIAAGESLLTGVGGRPMALGGAYTALANDPFAMVYNPAGLAWMRRPALSLMHSEWIQDTQQQYLAFGLPSKPGTIGFDFYRMDLGKIQGRNALGHPTQNFSAGDLSFGLSWAQSFHRNFLLGAKISYFQEELAGYKASTYFGDFGVMLRPARSWTLGAAVHNIGPGLRFIEETSPLPRNYTAGIGYFLGGMRLAADYKLHAEDKEGEMAAGIELAPSMGDSRPVALRLGQADISGKSMGVGAGFGLSLAGVGLDYAFRPFGILGGTHRVSFSVEF